MIKLTPRQVAIWQYIGRYKQRWGYAPTFREIGHEFNIQLNAVKNHLDPIQRKGFLTYVPGLTRTIVLSSEKINMSIVVDKEECHTCSKMQWNKGKNRFECVLDSYKKITFTDSCGAWVK